MLPKVVVTRQLTTTVLLIRDGLENVLEPNTLSSDAIDEFVPIDYNTPTDLRVKPCKQSYTFSTRPIRFV
jgi:hypothetical protein